MIIPYTHSYLNIGVFDLFIIFTSDLRSDKNTHLRLSRDKIIFKTLLNCLHDNNTCIFVGLMEIFSKITVTCYIDVIIIC